MCDVYISELKIFLHRRAECSLPLGMKSGRIEDSQITASDYVGKQVYFFSNIYLHLNFHRFATKFFSKFSKFVATIT